MANEFVFVGLDDPLSTRSRTEPMIDMCDPLLVEGCTFPGARLRTVGPTSQSEIVSILTSSHGSTWFPKSDLRARLAPNA